ncbi:MAG: sulfite exporter TauE/SafE family protein [Burkholderiaceae bacterium]|nr:sulfite exporter TauE/SafE family protein [Burkholderiaceae bacterium]
MEALAAVGVAFAIAGILKGATGAGAPVVVVPVLALFYDVQFAVAAFVVPGLVSNAWQLWQFRRHHLSRRFSLMFAGGGVVGATTGSLMLAWLRSETLMLLVAFGVILYIGVRLLRRDLTLSQARAERIVVPVGFLAGTLQGAAGISAPFSLTFLNAMRLARPQFVATISGYFLSVAIVQALMLTGLGIMTADLYLYGALALIPLMGLMPVGAWLVRHVSKERFDTLILALLFLLAVKLMADAIA